MNEAASLILASASPPRRDLLRAAGVTFAVDAARIDEDAIREGLIGEEARPHEIADALAELKATRISHRHGQAFVIGADQILYCEGDIYTKAANIDEAREHLLALRGRTHSLYTAVVVARQGEAVWRHFMSPKLTMRRFSDEFLEWYLKTAGETVLQSVGGYQLEGLGSQLFEHYEGDYFSILGLPLLPLMGFLRQHAVVPT